MSGGSMDYVFGRIDDAADSIETYRKEVSERPLENFEASDIYKKEHPEIPCFESPEKLKAEVLRYLSQAVQCFRAASIYAYSVEWLQSGDYGYDSFILKLRNNLKVFRSA